MFAATAADVRDVMVGGDWIVRDGRHAAFDVAAALSASGRAVTALVVDNIGLLVTNDASLGEGPLGLVRDAALVIEDGRVVAVERAGARRRRARRRGGALRDPGLRRLHTHLVFAGDRGDEFAARMAGAPYAAGGIRVTTEATRAASTEELAALAARAPRRGAAGPASPTSRSSPATASTSRPSAAAARSPRSFTDDVTFLGAHVVPAEYDGRADDYVALVCGEMLAACAPHARWIDVFCEEGAFDADQSRAVLEAGRAAGLGLRVHGNQLGPGPGVQLAVELGAASVDHCTYLTDADVEALAGGDTVATFLPATDFSTRQPYPDARRVIDAGAHRRDRDQLQPRLELHDLDGVLPRARGPRHAHDGRRGAARRHLGRRPRAAPHRRRPPRRPAPAPTLAILDAPSYSHLVYRPGVPLVAATLVGGRLIIPPCPGSPRSTRPTRPRPRAPPPTPTPPPAGA